MNISTWSIRNPVPPLALFLFLIVIGLASFERLPVTQFPNVDVPVITIQAINPGASPEQIASEVIKPIETAISDVVGVKHVTGTASESLASISIEFQMEVDPNQALNGIKDAVQGVRDNLPQSLSDPNIRILDVSGFAIQTYVVSDVSRSLEELSLFVDDIVARELTSAKSIAKVTRIGGATRAIEVELNPDRLQAFGLTVAGVNAQLRQNNTDLGGGAGALSGQEYAIRALGSASSIEALAATPITLKPGHTVRLDDLGVVKDGANKSSTFALYNGNPVVGFGVLRATGASDLTAGDHAKARIEQLKQAYPNAQFTLVEDTTRFTEGNYETAMHTLYEGAFLAILVVFFFLRSWRATIITAVALPLSIIPTFFVMNYLGFSLNTVSLLGITLVTGILVDDAIVEIENIVRHIHMGTPAYEASEVAASEIGLTVIAISLSIVAVFAPVSFMSGLAGQYFKQFGLTVSVAVLFSLLVARLLTPMIAAYFLRDMPNAPQKKDSSIMRLYLGILAWTLHNRGITLVLGIAVFITSLYSATLLPTEFVPRSDTGLIRISVELPPGSTRAQTQETTRQVSKIVSTVPEVETVFVDGSETKATVQIGLGSKEDRKRSAFEIMAILDDKLAVVPDARIIILDNSGSRDLSINVVADSISKAEAAAKQLVEQMHTLQEVVRPISNASIKHPEIQITPNAELAAALGVTSVAIAETLRVATTGESDANLAKYDAEDRQIPIIVRVQKSVREDLSRLAGIRIPSATGSAIPLGVIAEVVLAASPTVVTRYDRQYRVTVEADLADGVLLGKAMEAINGLPIVNAMPEGTAIENDGNAQAMNDVFSQFGFAMGAGLLLVYVVLVLLFSSFLTPITILLTLPLAIGGAIFALYLYGAGIGLPQVIGFLMLMAIVTKNAIMLVEFALEAISSGVAQTNALLDAGHKRARPIVMTTVAMAAGMLPSALALGEGGEFRAPMAIAVIGGLLVSTVLSLLFVPSLFSVMSGFGNFIGRLAQSVLGTNRPTPS